MSIFSLKTVEFASPAPGTSIFSLKTAEFVGSVGGRRPMPAFKIAEFAVADVATGRRVMTRSIFNLKIAEFAVGGD